MYVKRFGRIGLLATLTVVTACSQRQTGGVGESQQGIGGTSVSTDKGSYTTNESATVSWSSMPGGPSDWVSIAVQGSADDALVLWRYTGDTVAGSTSMSLRGLSAGTYVARAYTNNDFNKIAESASFTVSAGASATVSTDQASYTTNDTVIVSFSGMPPTPTDWISIAPQGSPVGTVPYWKYTGGTASGTVNFSGLATGTYVARIFANNSFTLEDESAPFSVTAGTSPYPLSTDASTYGTNSTVIVTFSNGPGNQTDWISISTPGSPAENVVQWTYLYGQSAGNVQFTGLAAGSYVARLHLNNGYPVVSETAVFTVTQSPTVTTDKSTYAPGESVVVTYSNMQGNPQDYIAIYTSPGDVYVGYRYTNGTSSGMVTFDGLSGGNYVAKAFFNNGPPVQATSAVFTVSSLGTVVTTNQSTYNNGDTVVVNFSGMQGTAYDWIGIYTSPGGSFVDYRYTGGTQSGMVSFTTIAPGTYVARAFFNNGYDVQAESPSFVVNP
jgi:hypothetical protein